MEKDKSFITHKSNGFCLNFPNGNWLSTVWGVGTYSENYDCEGGYGEWEKLYNSKMGSNTCEVMPKCSELVKKLLDATFPEETNGGVFGHMTFEKWLKMVNILNENV